MSISIAIPNFLQRAVKFVAHIGIVPEDTAELRLRKTMMTFSVLIYFSAWIFFICPFYLHFHEPVVAFIFGGFVLSSLIGLVWLAFQPRIYPVYLYSIFVCAFLTEFSGAIALGGFANSSGLPMLGIPIILGILTQYGPRAFLYWFGAYVLELVVSIFMQPYLRPENNLPHWLVQTLFLAILILVTGFSTLPIYLFLKLRNEALALFVDEKQKSETLLLNILPSEIADILKTGRSTIAEHYESASILFADVVDFTSLSERLTPDELVELLNEVFSHFDMLAGKYELEKIKTIGDCYMVAAGVPRPRSDHAQVITRMAMEMRDYARQREFAGRGLIFRMGISSGPVVAGVIGRKKFIYDLWGDAVNTASRMESHGMPGTIQITESTYELIKEEFDCEARGLVLIKGKGEMNVWHVREGKIAA